jgi:hypothetical protein
LVRKYRKRVGLEISAAAAMSLTETRSKPRSRNSGDGRAVDGVARPLLLAGPQSRRLAHLTTVTFMTRLLF